MADDGFDRRLQAATDAARAESNVEAALGRLTDLALADLGDDRAIDRPGALKSGERAYRVSGVFLITPDRKYNMLIASRGFPPEQRRLAIPITWNHPGMVVETQEPLLLENTDDHPAFRQFLKTSRMGSSIYVPMVEAGAMFGQIVVAAQVRWTYRPADLAAMRRIADEGERLWRDFAGSAWLRDDYPAPDLWDASVERVDG